eukprot:TRINITY_DN22390_c0_g1_i1.p1 TRINITY_DN22390_c0_g1~~TRINITY_DN22390_c0_g1_i1.p1  ORF type:complete len:226 (+),score=18.05 TRINITY_DN22390_c0_g1_i1:51-728(+)
MLVSTTSRSGLFKRVVYRIQVRQATEPTIANLRLKSPAEMDMNQLRDRGQVPTRQMLKEAAEAKRLRDELERKEAFAKLNAGGDGGASVVSTVFIWCINFGAVITTVWWTIFMLVDVGVPIPAFREKSKSPLGVASSWMVVLLIPSAFLSAALVPSTTKRVLHRMEGLGKAMKHVFVTRKVGDEAVKRAPHESGVNTLLKRRSNPDWNEKGLDIGVILNATPKDK